MRTVLKKIAQIVQNGDELGNNMVVRLRLPSGLEIVGAATKNFYGGEWDYGPSWNYFVLSDKPFLVDTGRFNMGRPLLDMLESAGVSGKDLRSVVISHGHEDHDGGLFEIAQATGAGVKAHEIYSRLICSYPSLAPAGAKNHFPASCWHCFMPESFSRENCSRYHKERVSLAIESVHEGNGALGENIHIYHTPGHSPDALAILLGSEAILVGDTVLPEITPFPSREEFFLQSQPILPPSYTSADSIYGLRAYLRTLRKLKEIAAKHPGLLVLPAHRFFSKNHWNELDLAARVEELVEHHIRRCADILEIVKEQPKSGKEIAVEYYDESRLKGVGIFMAVNEILSHCELLAAANDVTAEDGKFVSTGGSNFESFIRAL
jgi:glyoxylase-like metal-dependent hydrolase (beta-lactamase superfamily II)